MKDMYRQCLVTVTFLMLFALSSGELNAEVDKDFGAWGAIQGQGSFSLDARDSGKWQWWMEAQGRLFKDASRLEQSLIRPGFGYQLSKKLSVWLGYAWIQTQPKGRKATDENRIWHQASWKDSFGWGNAFSRSRFEHRFKSNGDDVGWRFREFLKLTHPLSSRFYASLWDEVFVDLNNTDWGADAGFRQNRFFAGLGAFVDAERHYRVEIGYLNQYEDKPSSTDNINHIVSCNLFIRY
jgi:hypothetical protein